MDVSKITNLKEDEKVLHVTRNFWVLYAPQWFVAGFFVVLAFFLMYPLFQRGPWGVGAFALLNVLGLWHAAKATVRWYWNGFIVTTARVVDVDQRGFFERVVSEVPYENIQDLTYTVSGVLGTVFNFGAVSIQTGSSRSIVSLTHARDPKSLHHLIAEAMAAKKFGSSAADAPGAPAGRTAKVHSLLEAAQSLTEAEAHAFLQALRQATQRPAPKAGGAPDDEDLRWYRDAKED